jgi:Holliday junction resolvase
MNLTRGKMRNIARVAMAKGWAVAILLSVAAGCTPRVEVAAPEKPITINLNVKIDHEIRVKVDKELDQVLSTNSGLF